MKGINESEGRLQVASGKNKEIEKRVAGNRAKKRDDKRSKRLRG